MKKFIALICILAAVFALCACNDTSPVQGQENSKTEDEIIADGEYFTVTKLTGNDGTVKYSYEIKSRDGEVLEHALCTEQPRIAQINKDLVGMRFTAEGHSFSRYFDIKNGRVSQSFKNAFWDNGTLVASNDYDNGHYFVVQSIFGDEYYSKADIESSSWQISVVGVELANKGGDLKVSYVHGDGSDTKAKVYTVILPLAEES